jgi:hypothetical protein
MKRKLFFFLSFLASVSLSAQDDNLIANGQFLEGTDSWEVLLNDAREPIKAHIEKGNSYKEYGLADNFIGTNFVELDEKSAVQQEIKTAPNKTHVLSFAYAHRPNAGNKQLIVAVDGKAIYTTTVKNETGTGVFMYKSVSFTPKSNDTKIAFYSVSLDGAADKGVLLTDIKCVNGTNTKEITKYNDIKY